MSNGKIFCWGFVLCGFVMFVAELFGVPSRYHGAEAMLARALSSTGWGVAAVALFGDREPRK